MTDQERIRVMIADDHSVVRSGLRFFLLGFDDMDLVGEAESGEEALQLCAEVQPDVILMDLVMPGMGGAAATKGIRESNPHVQVVALTSFQQEDLVQNALQAGAISYLLKDVSADELAQAIRSAHVGRPTLAPEAAQALLHAASQPQKLGYDLTKRERQVLPLVVEGLNNNEIAERLTISRSTVRFHVSNILSKLDAANRAEAAALAVKYNLLT